MNRRLLKTDNLAISLLLKYGRARGKRYNALLRGSECGAELFIACFSPLFRLILGKTLDCQQKYWISIALQVIMKLHSNTSQHYQTVTGYDETAVEINAVRFTHSLIVLPESAPQTWDVRHFTQLEESHFQQIAALNPDVVILGTGKRQYFIHPRLINSLTTRRIGVECMDSQAACRTYNILMSEGRRVALAMILESDSAQA